MITDAVLHIWTVPLNPELHYRTEPMSAEQLLVEMDRAGVDRAVLVPPRSFENAHAVESADRHRDRFRVMPVIDPRLPGASESFGSLTSGPMAVGSRVILHTPALARALEAGEFEGFWNEAESRGLPVATYPPGSLALIADVARRHPGLRLIIDHLGLPLRLTGARVMVELRAVLELARLPNVAVKASGLPTHSDLPFPFLDVRAPLQALIEAFGPERVFWGSDLTRLRCSYREAADMMSALIPDERVRRRVMGEALSEWIGWPEVSF